MTKPFMIFFNLSILFILISLFLLFKKLIISIEIPMLFMMLFNIPISIIIDWMSMMFLSTISFISSMILMFSMFYIPKKEHNLFFPLLLMFILSMFILIMSDNLILILLGWDGLGFSSYILVIYYQNFNSASSGSITIFMNRMGDIFMLMAISMIMMMNHSWNFSMNENFNKIIMLLLLLAACSKSAQFPFSAWLPAAMAAPTPISALVHSSTLVTAGVYLLLRIMNNIHPTNMFILMIISSSTCVYASLSANWEQDMKKIIALSTLSQIAMMMFSISINSISLAYFHLITHAMFKSLMFICAGILIHNSSYQDMRMMGITSKNSPLILSTMGTSTMALMAIPFMSGFFSKDMIIENLMSKKLKSFLTSLMILSVGLTTIYSLRMTFMSTKMNLLKTESNFHNLNTFNIPLIIMLPMSILLGTSMNWLINPETIYFMPLSMKMFIIFNIILGVMLALILSFKKNFFLKLGKSALSLWFNHTTSTSMKLPLSIMMNTFLKNDKTWQENYGPSSSFSFLMNMTKFPMYIMLLSITSLIMLIMYPIIFL